MSPLTHSYYSGASHAQIIYETIGSYFDKIADVHSTNPSIVARHQGINWTYGELRARVNRLATGLIHLGKSRAIALEFGVQTVVSGCWSNWRRQRLAQSWCASIRSTGSTSSSTP